MATTNINLIKLIEAMRKEKSRFWNKIADELEKGKVEVNIWKINKYTKEGDRAIVPGVVLGSGELGHKVTVIAWRFSKSAKQKLGDNAILIKDFFEKNKKDVDLIILK
ncbi:MAG: 50S ribosomal protein L18e [archaeon]